MTDDELLRDLASYAREKREENDAAWERLTRGEATADERRAIAAAASRSSEGARRLGWHAPLGDAAEDRVANRLLASLSAQAWPRPGSRGGSGADSPGVGLPARRAVSRRAFALYALAPAFAAAAAAGVLVARRPEGAALPAYAAALGEGLRETRAVAPVGDERPEVTLDPSSTFDLHARPAARAGGALAVRAALSRGDDAELWALGVRAARFSDDGALRISGPVGALFPGKLGAWDIVVAIARPRDLPADDDLRARARARSRGGEAGGGAARVRYVEARLTIVALPAE